MRAFVTSVSSRGLSLCTDSHEAWVAITGLSVAKILAKTADAGADLHHQARPKPRL
jgi:hypothetical protein